MKTLMSSKTLLLTILASAFLIGCGKEPSSAGGAASDRGASEGSVRKSNPFTVGVNPPGFEQQEIGQTQLVPFTSPDNSFSMLLPSAATCTENNNENTLFILCIAGSKDMGVMMYYSLQPELAMLSSKAKMDRLFSSAQRKIQGDMGAAQIASSIPVETQEIVKNDVPAVKATVLVASQHAMQSLSFIKSPFLIHINAFPNPKSPSGIALVKKVIDSIEPTAGDHAFAKEPQPIENTAQQLSNPATTQDSTSAPSVK